MASNNDDVENSGAGERTPMLGRSSRQRISSDAKDDTWKITRILHFFGGGIYAPNPSTYDPIKLILNEDDRRKDSLTARWRDNKLSELNFVGIVVCTKACIVLKYHARHKTLRYPIRRSDSSKHRVTDLQ